MLQPKSFQNFTSNRGALARDNGFFSRMLMCYPPSTQGYRENWYLDNPHLPNVKIVQQRLKDLLELALKTEGQPNFKRNILRISCRGKETWKNYSNFIERNLQPNGLFCDVKDAASKSAEKVARMAASFHNFEGRIGDIEFDLVDRAANICLWYLNEFKRIFYIPPTMPREQNDAFELDTWIRNQHRFNGCTTFEADKVQYHSPSQFCCRARFTQALHILEASKKIKTLRKNKNQIVGFTFDVSSLPYFPRYS